MRWGLSLGPTSLALRVAMRTYQISLPDIVKSRHEPASRPFSNLHRSGPERGSHSAPLFQKSTWALELGPLGLGFTLPLQRIASFVFRAVTLRNLGEPLTHGAEIELTRCSLGSEILSYLITSAECEAGRGSKLAFR